MLTRPMHSYKTIPFSSNPIKKFFLNLFDESMFFGMFEHLSSSLESASHFYIAVFGSLSKSCHVSDAVSVFSLAMIGFGLTAKNALRPLYNYKALLSHFDYQVEYDKAIKLFKVFPFFNVIIAKKPASI